MGYKVFLSYQHKSEQKHCDYDLSQKMKRKNS